ncbi:MAG: VOC family protein [Myxococcales bacterium]|nr:VOC family protein [Myxococcales bacterium]
MTSTDAPYTRPFYLNLAVADLPRARAFFAELGFRFDPRFTNEQAACMVINDGSSVMLLQRPFFQSFTPRSICDTDRAVEGLFAFGAPSRADVDALVERAVTLGASEAREPQDHGFMYARSFFDLDGHQWEVGWMNPDAFPPGGDA